MTPDELRDRIADALPSIFGLFSGDTENAVRTEVADRVMTVVRAAIAAELDALWLDLRDMPHGSGRDTSKAIRDRAARWRQP